MRVRSVKLCAGEDFFSTIIVKPPLTRLEARDYRVTRSGVMFRCMLIWRTITAADVAAFGASAKMQPPSAQSQTFDTTCSAWLGRRVDAIPLGLHELLSDFRLLPLPHIGGRTKGTLFDSFDLNGFWPGLQDGSRFGSWQTSRCAAPPRLGRPRRSVRGHHRCFHVSRRSAVSDARLALPNFYNITIRIANVAARLAVLVLGLCDKLGSSISP